MLLEVKSVNIFISLSMGFFWDEIHFVNYLMWSAMTIYHSVRYMFAFAAWENFEMSTWCLKDVKKLVSRSTFQFNSTLTDSMKIFGIQIYYGIVVERVFSFNSHFFQCNCCTRMEENSIVSISTLLAVTETSSSQHALLYASFPLMENELHKCWAFSCLTQFSFDLSHRRKF